LNEQGKLKVLTGSSPHGQGLETTLALLASKELGVPLEDVSVSWGDTASLPWSVGTFGSRSVAVGGSAVVDATRKVKADALLRASKISGIKEEELSIEQSYIVKRGESEKRKIMKLSSLMESTGPIESYSEFALKGMPFASGAHLCGVLIDKETGIVEVKKYIAVDDCGVPINPVIVEGQLHGGIVHGIGGSLLEIVLYDSNGQLLTSNFLDYTIPTANEVPREFEILHIETRSPLTLNGSKGVGESGTVGAYPAIFNALNDAISPLRNELNIAPALPEEILKVIQRKK
jgi:carbon-monoxide dehydrogenase large subunit